MADCAASPVDLPPAEQEAALAFAQHLRASFLAALSPRADEQVLLFEHGNGDLAACLPQAMSIDRLFTPQANPRPHVLCLPERLPLPTDYFAAIGGLDVLGHSPSPAALLAEIERCLCVGGRAVLVEPWMGWIGGLAHVLRGHRRLSAGLDPWFDACPIERREEGNAAVAQACFYSRVDELTRHAPALEIRRLEPFGGLAELGSLSRRCGRARLDKLMALEHRLPRWVRRLTASRALIILEKISLPCSEDDQPPRVVTPKF